MENREKKEKSNLQIWAEREVEIACKKEDAYGCGCYHSALKAFESLCDDDHSGCSIKITKEILNRLIDGKPLTAIEDTKDVWGGIDKDSSPDYISYQCKRCSALFKHVYTDGHVEYSYNDQCYCVDIKQPEASYRSGFVSRIIREMFPITMPFMPPAKPIKVVCDDFLTDEKNGDFDTVGILYCIKSNGEKIEINRFFKEEEKELVEISKEEYEERKAIKIR